MNKIPTLSGLPASSAGSITEQANAVEKAKNLKAHGLGKPKDVEKAAGGFEALLLHQMFESMWSTVDYAGMFNEKSNESQYFRDMLSQAVADNTSKGRGIGVKTFLEKELLRKYEASKKS
ncbi:MAG: rod-binding protein [Bdellovibrionota bacterium]